MPMTYRGAAQEPAHIIRIPIDEFLNDPIVGVNVQRRGETGSEPRSPFIAFQMLSAASFVRQDIDPLRRPNPIIACLDGPATAVSDMATVWRWRPAQAKRFIRDIESCGLIDRDLAIALLAKVGANRRRERRPPLPQSTRTAVLAKTAGRCVYCGVSLTMQRDQPNSYHADHLFPVRDGATDDPGLLVPACADCNQKKGAKTLAEFIAGRSA